MNKLNKISLTIFNNILQMSQEDLHFYLLGKLESFYSATDIFRQDGSFIYVKGDNPVLMVAHLDTVHDVLPTPETLFHDQEKNIMWCIDGIGGDDRCGVFSILDILTQGYRPHLLFCWDEEIGTVGSQEFVNAVMSEEDNQQLCDTLDDITFAIQLDRKGFSEAVYYDLDNREFEDYINKFGFETCLGSFTDICQICPALGIAGVNLSAGYMDEHTSYERIYIDELYATQEKVIKILEDQENIPHLFTYKEKASAYRSSPYSYGGSLWTEDESDYLNYMDVDETKFVENRTEKCDFCDIDINSPEWFSNDQDILPKLNQLCEKCRDRYMS